MDIPTISGGELITLVLAAIVGIGSTARMARLLTHDHMPLFKSFREWWGQTTNAEWGLLMFCHYCAAVWLAFPVVLWGYFSDLGDLWWLFHGSLALSYFAAILVSFDGDNSE